MDDYELDERRQAEIEFVSSAYAEDEAWCDSTSSSLITFRASGKSVARKESEKILRVHRRLSLPIDDASEHAVSIVLSLSMPLEYPATAPLQIASLIEESRSTGGTSLLKAANNALPQLAESCRQVASEMCGDESVFTVLSHADEWIQDRWPPFYQSHLAVTSSGNQKEQSTNNASSTSDGTGTKVTLGRRLIYAHHIISKIKRADMKQLGAQHNLTGYVKIGWPGIIIIEGAEESCQDFYDDIKVWAWKYLVVRGEQQVVVRKGANIDSLRRFETFQEVSEMSIVATHCREVGLEALFRTSMKLYDNSGGTDDDDISGQDHNNRTPYGTLIWVDHMNDGKSYRKWLRKTGLDTDVFLLIKQCYPSHDFTKRPTILVAIVAGNQENVSGFMKRWRTSRVDVDSRGKGCLERKMTILHEGEMEDLDLDCIDWDKANTDEDLNLSQEQLVSLIDAFGDSNWREAVGSVLSVK